MENVSFAPSGSSNNTTAPLTWIQGDQSGVEEIVLFAFVGILITFENAASILVFWRCRSFLKLSTILLINLTTADLIVGFAVICRVVGEFLPQSTVIEDVHFKVAVQLDAFSGLSSIFFLAAISIEKCHSILRPLHHVVMPTKYYVTGMSSVWLLTGFLSALTLLSLCGYMNERVVDIVVISFIGLALLITCVSYISIWLKFSCRNFTPQTPATEMNKKLVKTLFIVTVLSVITWLPFYIVFILLHLFPSIPLSNSLVVATRLLQFANSLVNPIVYNLKMPQFRKAMKKLICGYCVKTNLRLALA